MKKIIQILFIIIFAILLSGAVGHAIVTDLEYGKTSRGKDVWMEYSGGASWGDDKWFPDMKGNVAVYCAQHGGTFFKYVQPNVTVNVFLGGAGYSGNSQSFQLPKSSTLSEEFVVWSGDVGHGPPDVKLITMLATAYSGYNKGTISGACGPKVAVGSDSATIYTTGITKFSGGGGGGGPNTKMAYILAETQYNTGAPSSSYVQYAFWAAQGGGGSSSISSDIFSNPGDLGDDGDDAVDSSAFGPASGLYGEACDFASMISAMGGSYNVTSLTDENKITVEFDGDTNIYTVGPFAIEYLERYTGTAQLSGMYGIPELTVRKNGDTIGATFVENLTPNSPNGSWSLHYKTGRVTAGIPPEYQIYPHSGEKFYVNLKYDEGIEKIVGLNFQFRYLQADGSYTKYTGNIEKVEWKAELEVKSEKCTAHSLCTWGSAHDSPETHDYDDDDEPIKCSGGYHCTHASDGFESYTHHMKYTEVKCKVTANPAGTIDIQDAATCAEAWRKYFPTSFSFDVDIDLTTMMAGNVWLDIDAQKDNTVINGIRDDIEKKQIDPTTGTITNEGTGQQNVAVTVYLYKGNAKVQRSANPPEIETAPLETALMHDENGKPIQWPIYTEEDGYWHVDRIEAPATNNDTECFYVVEFQYDGQVLRHTVFLADASGYKTKVDTYNSMPNSYSNSSMAVEDQDERYLFDQKFGVITGEKSIDETTGNTEGQIYRTNEAGQGIGDQNTINYTSDLKSADPKKLVTSKLDSAATEERGNIPEKVTEGSGYELYKMSAKTFYDETPLHGTAPDPTAYRIEYPIKKAGQRKWTLSTGTKRYIDEYMLHINLGLQKRPQTDMSVLKDLYKVTMVVNEQKLTKQFNYLKDIDPEYTQAFETLYEKKKAHDGSERYSLGLYPEDLSYQAYNRYHNAIDKVYNIKKNSEIRVYVSYVVRVYNNSETNAVELNELTDYFDPTYTLVQEDVYDLNDNEKYMWEDLPAGQEALQTQYGRQEVKTSIVDEKLHRDTQVVADAPYYRVMNTSGGISNCIWKETKEKNLEGISDTGYFNWTTIPGQVNEQKVTKTVSFTEKKLMPNEYLELFTTYEVDKEGYDAVRNLNNPTISKEEVMRHRENLAKALSEAQDKENLAEISSYSTYYGEKDVDGLNEYYAPYTGYPQGTGYGWVSGRVDKDSAPNNILLDTLDNMKNGDKYEDDTNRSVPIKISILEESVERTMTGIVWEDEKNTTPQTTVGETFEIQVGNGYIDSGESGIKNVEVSLYEVINLGALVKKESGQIEYDTTYDEYDYYYKVPNEFYTTDGATVKTNPDGTYELKGFLPGDYIVRFDYGKHRDAEYDIKTRKEIEGGTNYNIYKYNGQDYENTKFMASNESYKFLNKKYLDITERNDVHLDDNMSVARDNESRRLVVNSYSRTIENDRAEILRNRGADMPEEDNEYRNATQMFAETPIMQVEIRDPKIVEKEEKQDGEYSEKYEEVIREINSSYTISGINFGLEKRAETDIELEKFIDTITLYKEETPILIAKLEDSGIINVTHKDSMNLKQITYLSHSESRTAGVNESGTYNQGFYAIDTEVSYLNNLNLDIRYKIRSTNKSEVDFTGEIADYTVASDIIEVATQTAEKYLENLRGNIAGTSTATDIVGIASNNTIGEIELAQAPTVGKALTLEDRINVQKASDANTAPELGSSAISATDTIKPQVITYGKYVGRFYYENKIDENKSINRYELNDYAGTGTGTHLEPILINYEPDKVVKTTVDRLVDYIDIDARFDEESQSVNEYWDKAEAGQNADGFINSLNGLITKETLYDEDGKEIEEQKGAYREFKGRLNIYDNKDRKYITETSSNIMLSRNEHLQNLSKYRDREGTGRTTDPNYSKYVTYIDYDYSRNGRVEYQNDDTLSIYNSRQTIQLVPEAYYNAIYGSGT